MPLDNINRWSKRKIVNIGKDLVEWLKQPGNYWFGGFCAQQGFHRQRLPEFADENPKFRRYYEQAKALQEEKLINLVIENNTNASFIMFLLKNISRDLRDKQDIELSGEIHQKIKNQEIGKMSKEEIREFLRQELGR